MISKNFILKWDLSIFHCTLLFFSLGSVRFSCFGAVVARDGVWRLEGDFYMSRFQFGKCYTLELSSKQMEWVKLKLCEKVLQCALFCFIQVFKFSVFFPIFHGFCSFIFHAFVWHLVWGESLTPVHEIVSPFFYGLSKRVKLPTLPTEALTL